MQDAHLAETEQSLIPIRPQHQQRQRQNQQLEEGENFDYYVDRKTGWRYYREPRKKPPSSSSSTSQRPTSQWQTSWSSWQPTSSETWWWFRFPGKNSKKSTGGVDSTSINTAHTAQYSLFTSAERIARAWLKNCSVIFVRLKRICDLVRTCLSLCCSLTCSAPRAHLLPHSLFLLSRHQNTHYNRDNTIYSKNT